MKAKFLAILFFCSGVLLLAQPSSDYRDSVKVVLKSQLPDTSKVLLLIDASNKYLNIDTKVALDYALQARDFAVKANYSKGIALAYKYTGMSYYFKSQYIEALSEWQQSFNFFDSIDDKQGESNILGNMGAAYFSLGENDKALERYLIALRIAESMHDTLRKATLLINIGAVYFDKPSTHELALKNYLEALDLAILLGNDRAIGTVCVNMGEIYLTKGEDVIAMEYYIKAYNAVMGLDAETTALLGIGDVHAYRKEYEKALDYHQRAFKIASENDTPADAVNSLIAMARTNKAIKNYRESVNLFKQALPLAKKIEANKQLQIIYEELAANYSKLNQFDSAYHYQELFGFIKDTIFNLEADKKLNMLRLDYEIEKKESEIKQLTELNKVNEESIQRRKIITNLVVAGLISVLVFLYIALKQKRSIQKEKQRSEELLLNILPYEVAEELKEKGESDAKNYTEVTVLFTDFISFTDLAQKLTAKDLVKEINFYFKAFDEIISKYGIEKIKTIGDAYMAAGGLPIADESAPKKVVLASLEMQQFVLMRQRENTDPNASLFNMRAGIHTGPVVAGIVGVKKFQYDIWGDTVNTASRMESYGEIAKVNVSEATYEKLKNEPEFEFEHRGLSEVKGKGKMNMYFVSLKS